ncbi:uncharacterized protein [Antedon mediterranea]|uniref:uncharacterized protein n=1 Tax=Antedon mediterranea TaxID=105859 RepID=UPI003AF90E64
MRWQAQSQWVIISIFLFTVTPSNTQYCYPESTGLEDGDHQLTASSASDNSNPDNARYDVIQPLDSQQISCWQPASTDVFPWIQVDFTQLYDIGSIQFQECGGTESSSSNVILNGVEYSLDASSFQPFLDSNGALFGPVRIDSSQFETPVEFWKPFVARQLKLNIGSGSKFRFEVFGCAQTSNDWYCDGGVIDTNVSA